MKSKIAKTASASAGVKSLNEFKKKYFPSLIEKENKEAEKPTQVGTSIAMSMLEKINKGLKK